MINAIKMVNLEISKNLINTSSKGPALSFPFVFTSREFT